MDEERESSHWILTAVEEIKRCNTIMNGEWKAIFKRESFYDDIYDGICVDY